MRAISALSSSSGAGRFVRDAYPVDAEARRGAVRDALWACRAGQSACRSCSGRRRLSCFRGRTLMCRRLGIPIGRRMCRLGTMSAVHCYGVPQIVGRRAASSICGRWSSAMKASAPNGWSVDELEARDARESAARDRDVSHGDRAHRGQGEASQNKPRAERERVIEGLKAAGETKLVALMQAGIGKSLNRVWKNGGML